ncbi:MAG: ThuA domain-containing protein [Planctomycetes bacterium]|nr:ThuA domain-containing protein [Planctomycetota bacterium]
MLLAILSLLVTPQLDTSPLNVLFIGDRGFHKPVERLDDVYGKLIRAGVAVDYEDDVTVLDLGVLRKYDTIVMYANQAQHSKVPIEFMQSLTRYVRGGGGFVGLHCTSGCFTESDSWLKFIGARFESHQSEVFSQAVVGNPELLKGWSNFTAWDETYVQTHVEDDRTILTMRGDEPWTWIRNVGKGRLFYSASGHDARVWTTDGFFDMLLRAIVYTSGDDAQLREYPQDLMQRASTPQQAVDALVVPAGMHVELFACEPMVINPIAMAWDEGGRCWVVESPGYPDSREGGDSVSILEDTNGDGRADKKTVFADGLNLPTSVLKVDGGVLVTQAPDLLFLKDNNGDDVCDERQVVLSGFGVWDTHAGPANLRWGPDNYIWGTVGYSGYKNDAGSFGSGLWRWKPGLDQPEFMAQFSNNTWGLDFTSKGEIWGSTANNAPSFFVGLPNARLALPVFDSARVHPALAKVRQGDFFGNFTAATSHSFATGNQFPEWWNERSAFICEPTTHSISRFESYKSGAGYRTRDCFNVAVSVDDWFCPVQVDVGPDGALWIADFCEGNAHLNPLRDKAHGRIFRVVRDGVAAQSEFDLLTANADEVLAALDSSNKFWRVTARRLLLEKNMSGATGILNSIVRKFLDKGENGALMAQEALRVLGGFDEFNHPNSQAFDTLKNALIFQNVWFGEVALDVMPRNEKYAMLLAESDLINSPASNLQRHALIAAAEMPQSYAIANDLLEAAIDLDRADVWLSKALELAIQSHAGPFTELAATVAASESQAGGPANSLLAYLEFAQQQPNSGLSGDAKRGKDVFKNNAANCVSCHPGIGPDLAGVGERLSAEEIKQAIINPTVTRAAGWEDNPVVMPEVVNFLSAQDVADLVEYLSAL